MGKPTKNPLPWKLQGGDGKLVAVFLDANGEDIFGKAFWTDPAMKESGSYIELSTAKFIIETVNKTIEKNQ